jgi:hypothetical protein
MRALQAAGVPAMPVLSSEDLLEDEHLGMTVTFGS